MSDADEIYLLDECDNKYSLYPPPGEYMHIWNSWIAQNSALWFQNEINLDQDEDDFNFLTFDEKNFLKHIIAFFSFADGIVIENLIDNFIGEIKNPYIRMVYQTQVVMENIHAVVYGMLLEKYITDPIEYKHFKNSNTNIDFIKKKADWALKWMNKDIPLNLRLVAFACVEGIFFYGSFASIFWMRERGLLPGLSKSNTLIETDERSHRNFAVLLINKYLVNKPDEFSVHEIVKSATETEIEFICNIMPNNLKGLNKDDMIMYLKSVANDLTRDLKFNDIKEYKGIENPLHFTKRRHFQLKENFFETTTTQYKKPLEGNQTITYRDDF